MIRKHNGKGSMVYKKTLCEEAGHQWVSTASDNVKVCSRGGCHVVKQLIAGHWRIIGKVAKGTHDSDVRAEAVKNAGLWEEILG